MNNDINFQQVPFNWPVCYVAECSRRDECMRYQAHLLAPRRTTCHLCVLPTAMQYDQCPHFHAIRKVRAAAGFRNLFAELKEKHLHPVRIELTAYLGSKTTYYKYKNGERLLMPAQQEWVKKLLRRHGYTAEVRFDGYQDVYVFE